MGGRGSGRKWIYDDERHKAMRKHQYNYDHEIREIRKNHKCSYKEAQRIRIERLRREAKRKQKVK